MPSLNANAERLKAEGNELHQKRQFQEAHKKYTEAIKEDPTNPIYYANRAASSLEMKEYLDAASDAKKATEMDPKYAKAWSRLANAKHMLSSYTKSIEAWNKAIQCLPPMSESNATEKNLREQFTRGLMKAEKAKSTPSEFATVSYRTADQKVPWQRAAEIVDELTAQRKISSAFVILHAYQEFKEGVDQMKTLKKAPLNGQLSWQGHSGALANISNGVMRDPRVLHFDCSDWLPKYRQQVTFEATLHKAWVHGGAKTLMEEAPKRLEKEGWDRLRPALSTTIRAWIMSGLLSNSMGKFATALEYYTRALDVLEWGTRKWKDVSELDRGIIFGKTFVRGVRRLRLTSMHSCVASKEADTSVTSDDLATFAREIIAETDANPPTSADEPLEAGFAASFWMYPKADALAMLGWHYMQLGNAAINADDAQAAFSESAKFYTEAAATYPPDDESTIYYYRVALEAYWLSPKGISMKDNAIATYRISYLLPGVQRIWEHSEMSKQLDGQIGMALRFMEKVYIRYGGQSKDDIIVRPQEMKHLYEWGGDSVFV